MTCFWIVTSLISCPEGPTKSHVQVDEGGISRSQRAVRHCNSINRKRADIACSASSLAFQSGTQKRGAMRLNRELLGESRQRRK